MIIRLVFWLSFFFLFYHILLYPLILWVFNKFLVNRKYSSGERPELFPTIAVICPAYNEETHIEAKIKSFLSLDYPTDKIHLYIISDDSTDATNDIVSRYLDRNVSLIIQAPRGGKQKAHNLVEPSIKSDYVLSTDANSIFEPDAVKRLVGIIESDPKIGIVSGELKLIKMDSRDSGEGLYWKYECFLKRMDSNFASIIGSNGSIYLIRRSLFKQIYPDTIDDFERTLFVISQHYKAIYEPNAIVTEEVTEKAGEEINRKVRIITREWIALKRYSVLLNPFKFGRITFILISHKLIRWLFFLFLILMLLSSALLQSSFYQWIFLIQILFYWIGIIEILIQNSGKHIPGAGNIAYITAMGWSSLLAFFRFIFKANTGIWDPVRKQREN